MTSRTLRRSRAAVLLAGLMAVVFPAAAQAYSKDSPGVFCPMPFAQDPHVYVNWKRQADLRWDLSAVVVGCRGLLCDDIDTVSVSVSDGTSGAPKGGTYFLMPDHWQTGLLDVSTIPELKSVKRGHRPDATITLTKPNGRKCTVVTRGFAY